MKTRLPFNKRRQPFSTVGEFASVKSGQVHWVGTLRRDLAYRLEADPGVRSFELSPDPIVLELAGRQHSWPVDAEVHRTDGTWLHMLEPNQPSPIIAGRLERLSAWSRSPSADGAAFQQALNGRRFRVIPEAEVRSEPELTNAKLLVRMRGVILPHVDWHTMATAVVGTPLATVRGLASLLPGQFPLHQVYGWILAGRVHVDPRQRLDANTPITAINTEAVQ